MPYKSEVYPKSVSKEVRDALDNFYHHSNASSTHNDHETDDATFADLFTGTGTYEFMGRKATGRQEIIALRKDLFNEVPHRDHPIKEIFTYGEDDLELMSLGTVGYKYHSGDSGRDREWAGHYSLEKVKGGGLKFKYVKIIGDSTHPEGAEQSFTTESVSL